MLRRLHIDQPKNFEFSSNNLEWAKSQLLKYPLGRQASAVIPLLWRAQEQEGWLTKPAIEYVAEFLQMAPIRVFEVASFYFMFQLQPVGEIAHIQICGTTPCMLCDSEDLIAICKEKISSEPRVVSKDGKLSWEEVECLGACSNAPVAQIGKDYYEDLSAKNFVKIIEQLVAGQVPISGSQTGRFASEPQESLSALKGKSQNKCNASVAQALAFGDTVKRIK